MFVDYTVINLQYYKFCFHLCQDKLVIINCKYLLNVILPRLVNLFSYILTACITGFLIEFYFKCTMKALYADAGVRMMQEKNYLTCTKRLIINKLPLQSMLAKFPQK